MRQTEVFPGDGVVGCPGTLELLSSFSQRQLQILKGSNKKRLGSAIQPNFYDHFRTSELLPDTKEKRPFDLGLVLLVINAVVLLV